MTRYKVTFSGEMDIHAASKTDARDHVENLLDHLPVVWIDEIEEVPA